MNERTTPPPPRPLRPISKDAAEITGRDREFLPAALEILETPPPPLSIVIMLTICAFFAAAIVWSFYSRLDVHAVATGEIETAGRTKVIQPLDPGKIAAIHVENGQHVKAGDLLLELDPAEASAEEQTQRDALDSTLTEVTRRHFAVKTAEAALEAAAKSDEASAPAAILAPLTQAATDPEPQIDWGADLPKTFRSREASVLSADLNQLIGALQSLDTQMAQKDATRQRLEMGIETQNSLIQTLTQLVNLHEQAVNLAVGTKITLYTAKEELEKSQSSLASDKGELIETSAALRELESEKIKTLSQFVADYENKTADAERKADEAKQALVKARVRLARTKLYSPIDGVAQQIAVTTIGQVVTTGQQLLIVAPTEGVLQIEALVANLDIGFVKPGQAAVIKVDAFPFTQFGVLHGTVTHIATAAVDEQEAKRALANAPAAANAPGLALDSQPGQPTKFVFPVTIAPEELAMTVGSSKIPLTPGMTVTVEIKTDNWRVIDYLISPLAKIASEAMRER
ncbi:HlyD family type I secretion periplasmic adaptor subunit [Rhizobium lusitanum]|uniref:Membrane fusion protein (MFP) family protein n=1 Tax=Rhizobium lusitanum TaxID=293958 RepID=A0A7X0MDP9_9HYPH|nr:HlyD family type I secretion periplasmic adaptor subunit [Rhizobium lusitanum]MBB6487117.1 hemolysin D [Rhizobium lusitanum]